MVPPEYFRNLVNAFIFVFAPDLKKRGAAVLPGTYDEQHDSEEREPYVRARLELCVELSTQLCSLPREGLLPKLIKEIESKSGVHLIDFALVGLLAPQLLELELLIEDQELERALRNGFE